MPALDASINTLRERYDFRTFITTPAETVVFSRAVNMASITYPLTSITYDNPYSGTGAFGDVLEDYEIIVYSQNTSTVKGRLRVASGAATSTVIQVNEISAGRLSLTDNDRFDVVRGFRVRDRLVGATSSFPKDSRIAYSDQNANPAPICNSGGHWAGFVDAGQTYATVQFTGSTSFNVDPDSGGTVTHSWAFGDGTPTTSTSADPSATFPVGERWISHTATDASNSRTTTQYIYVAVFNETTTRPTDCIVDDMSATVTDGWRCSVTVPSGWTQTQAPDGALIIVWERETYGGTVTSFGANTTGRSHIKFVGHLVADTVTRDYERGTVSFEAINPVALLAQLPGFSQVLNIKNSPVNWRQVKGLTTNRALIYLLRWGTTLLRTHDLILAGNNYSYPQLYVQAQTPDAQVREIADGVGAVLVSDRRGRVSVQHDLLQATSAQRTAATTTLTLTSTDIVEFDFNRAHRYDTGTLEGRGFIAASTIKAVKPALSLAPGKAPSEAPGKSTVERMIVDSQTTLNTRTGYLYAKQNKLVNGLPSVSGSIVLPGNFDVFDTYAEWITLTLAAALNKRGVSLSSNRFVVEGIGIEYDSDRISKRVRLTVQQETDGVAGVTKQAAVTQKNNLPTTITINPPRIDFPYFIPSVPTGNAPGVGTMQALLAGTTRYTTSDINAYTTSWVSAATSGTSGSVCDWIVDASTIGSVSVNAIVVTTTRIYTVTNIFSTPTVTLRHTFGTGVSSVLHRRIVTSRFTPNAFVVFSYYGSSGGTTCTWSTDSGVNWTESTVSTHYNTTTAGLHGTSSMRIGGWLSEKAAGVVFTGAYTTTAAGQSATSSLFVSTDYGDTWSSTSGMTNARWTGYDFHFPYQNNLNDRYFYWTKCDTSTTLTLMRTDRVLGTETELTPVADGNTYGAVWVATSDIDRLSVVAVAIRPDGANYRIGVSNSRDGGATWQSVVATTQSIGNRWLRAFFASNSRDIFYLTGEDGKVALSPDFGFTINDKTISAASDDVLRLVGS